MGYPLFYPLSQRESIWRYTDIPYGLRMAMLGPAKAGTGMGLAFSLVLDHPRELPSTDWLQPADGARGQGGHTERQLQ